MSTSGITSSLLAEIASSPSAANQFATDLNQLAQDLQSGNLSAAQQDYVTLSQDALNGATSSTATTTSSGITTALLSSIASSTGSSSSFVSELNQLGTDLANGDLSSAQGDMLSLDSTALGAAPSSGTTAAPSTTATASTSNQADMTALINATIQAMQAGDDADVSTDMSQLASISTSSDGASNLQSAGASYGSGSSASSLLSSSTSSSTSSSQGSLSELLASLNSDDSSSSSSALSLLA